MENTESKTNSSEQIKKSGNKDFKGKRKPIIRLSKVKYEEKIVQTISPLKDVDGLCNENLGLLASGSPRFVPATPLGVQRMISEIDFKTQGSRIVIIGRSKLVGIPLALLLSSKTTLGNATVTICHSRSEDIKKYTLEADIVVVATGFPSTLTKDMVKKNSIVIDVGVNRKLSDLKLWKKNDPILRLKKSLKNKNLIKDKEIFQIEKNIKNKVDQIFKKTENIPLKKNKLINSYIY